MTVVSESSPATSEQTNHIAMLQCRCQVHKVGGCSQKSEAANLQNGDGHQLQHSIPLKILSNSSTVMSNCQEWLEIDLDAGRLMNYRKASHTMNSNKVDKDKAQNLYKSK